MNYKRVLKRFRKNLDCEIGTQTEPFHLAFMHKLYTDGKMTGEDCIEMRGYYKGLKVAREILERVLDEEKG